MRARTRRGVRAVVAMVALLAACGAGGEGRAGTPPSTGQGPTAAPPGDGRQPQEAVYVLRRPWTSGSDWNLARVLADGTTELIPTPPGANVETPDLSPDGTQMAYTAAGGGRDGIWVTDLARPDAEPRALDHPVGAGCPRWFPDGRHLAAVVDDQVAVIDTSSGEAEVVGPRARGLELSCADPIDDVTLAVVAAPPEDDGRPQLSRLTVEDGTLDSIGTVPEECILNSPAAAPDGREIAVVAICDDVSLNGLYRVAADGGEMVPVLAENPPGTPFERARQYWDPAWSADGRFLYYDLTGDRPSSVWRVGRLGEGNDEVVTALACCSAVGPDEPTPAMAASPP